jgi:hypothetical protein
MNKIAKISLITAGCLGILAGGGVALYGTLHKTSTPDTSLNVNGYEKIDIEDINKTYTSSQYLSMINQYTKEIDGLKVELANKQEKFDQTIIEYQNEITKLQAEISSMSEDNSDLLKEKNERIETLKAYIETMGNENKEMANNYEDQINKLNTLLANYETKVLQTIKLPSDFVFTSLGFKIIENNDFIFYSTSHSCKLYYYHFDTETLETIPIKGTNFDSFYKLNNVIYFRTSKMLYRYDFHTQEINILGSANGVLTYTADTKHLYVFDTYGGYGVLNFGTMIFENYLQSTDTNTVEILTLDNYIIRSAYSVTKTNSERHYNIRCFNTQTQIDDCILENESKVNSFIKTNSGYFMCVGKGFYKFNILSMSLELIQDLETTNNTCYSLDGKIVIFAYTKAYIYDGTTVTQIATYPECFVKPTFFKLSNGVYYVVSNNSSFKGIWKLDLTNNTLNQLSSSCNTYVSNVEVSKYIFIGLTNGIYVLDKNTGAIDTMAVYSNGYNYTLKTIDCGNNVIIYCSINGSTISTYVYYYDKINDIYGKIYNGASFGLKDCELRNGILYIQTSENLLTFNPSISLNNCIDKLSIDSSLSNLKLGVFYANIGTLDGSKLYIKYTLQDDGTFTKDLVII